MAFSTIGKSMRFSNGEIIIAKLECEDMHKWKTCSVYARNSWEEGVSKFRCTLWLYFYKQSPDFHKPGLCHVAKFLYLCDIQ